MTGIHDIGFIPRLRDGVRGVEIRVGGGTSIMSRIAPTLYEFVELENGDYLKVAEACWRIFDRQEWLRENRARARIKVLIDKVGIDAFREMVEEEFEGDWVDQYRDSTPGFRTENGARAVRSAHIMPGAIRRGPLRSAQVGAVRDIFRDTLSRDLAAVPGSREAVAQTRRRAQVHSSGKRQPIQTVSPNLAPAGWVKSRVMVLARLLRSPHDPDRDNDLKSAALHGRRRRSRDTARAMLRPDLERLENS
jgi:sulfite reductase beta subunit-like hemoprotein